MELQAAMLRAGVEAVIAHRNMSNSAQDDEVPERFISFLMALKLHETLGLRIRVERQYTSISDDLALNPDPDSRQKITGLIADIAIYDGRGPMAVIEVKVFDEAVTADSIRDDLHKGDPVHLSSRIDVWAGIMLCETATVNLEARKRQLEQLTEARWAYSEPVLSSNREWHWCFACGSVARAPDRVTT